MVIGACVWPSISHSIFDLVGHHIRSSVVRTYSYCVENYVRNGFDFVCFSIHDFVYAYISSIFPSIEKWNMIKYEKGRNPFEKVVQDLSALGSSTKKIESA